MRERGNGTALARFTLRFYQTTVDDGEEGTGGDLNMTNGRMTT